MDRITADYAVGVLTVAIPVRESAKPHTVLVTSHDDKQQVSS